MHAFIQQMNKESQYSTVSYIQYPEIKLNGEEYKKECTFVYN